MAEKKVKYLKKSNLPGATVYKSISEALKEVAAILERQHVMNVPKLLSKGRR